MENSIIIFFLKPSLRDDLAPVYNTYSVPTHQHQPPVSYQTSSCSDDVTYRMRPDTSAVNNRSYNKFGNLQWSWTDFTRDNRRSSKTSIKLFSDVKTVF